MNFIENYKKGQEGYNKGLFMGEGCEEISRSINGVQKGMIYSIAAAPKGGKSTFTDYAFVVEPWLDSIKQGIPFEIIYNSYEIDRVSKEFDLAACFLARDYQCCYINLPEGITRDGLSQIEISSKYLRGRLQDDNGNLIKVKENVEEALKKVYEDRIIPLFGEYSVDGKLIKKGVITFHENRNNPTGIRNDIIAYAEERGKFQYEHYHVPAKNGQPARDGKKMIGYIPNDPNLFVLIVTDHLRKIVLESGFTLKQAVDKYSEYCCEIRNFCNFSFVQIIHLNRSMADTQRMKFAGDLLFASGDDIKDSGNLSEDSDLVFTMLNPNDEKYNLSKHFGIDIKDSQGNDIYPNYRSIHLVENRHGDSPLHFRVNMKGNIKSFEKFKEIKK